MMTARTVSPTPPARTSTGEHPFSPRRLGRDYAYVLPGFFISLLAFCLLVPLMALSAGTLVIWVGALLLPLTLVLASGFAELSRLRLCHWGLAIESPRHPAREPGVVGFMKRMAEPRRWLDLVFETLVAFPLRTFTFSVTILWSVIVLSGITYPLWGVFLPRGEPNAAGLALEALTNGAVPDSVSRSFFLDAAFNLFLGIVFLLTLPFVMHGLAKLDAVTTRAALGALPDELLTAQRTRLDPTAEHTAAYMPQSPGSAHPSDVMRPEASAPRSPVDAARTHAYTAQTGTTPDRNISADGWAWITAGFAGVVLLAVGWPVTAALYGVPVVFAMLVALGHSLALGLAVGWPYAGIVLTTVSLGAAAALTAHTTGIPWPWPVTGILATSGVILLVALRGPWHRAVTAWFLPQVVVVVPAVLQGMTPGALSSLITAASVTAAAGLMGVMVRKLSESRGALTAERRTSAELTAKQQELAERNRIAQELHDVVAHSMSVISVQATTARYRLPQVGEDAQQEFASIADSSRRALSEMRGLLTVLRTQETDTPLAPQPTLGDVPALVEATRTSGAHIVLGAGAGGVLDLDAVPVPPATGLTAYRIVQEALSNAVRHAPGAAVEVAVTTLPEEIVLDVVNGPVPAAADPGAESGAVPSAPGAGLGLRGIRERAHALGGIVETGTTSDGGFRVHAVLPFA